MLNTGTLQISHHSRAAIAQLGERQTEDLKVPGSIPGLGMLDAFPMVPSLSKLSILALDVIFTNCGSWRLLYTSVLVGIPQNDTRARCGLCGGVTTNPMAGSVSGLRCHKSLMRFIQAAIAQLGERQTEDLKVPGSIPGLGNLR